jgi:hypothetical protein
MEVAVDGLTLPPGQPTQLPGTGVELRWDGGSPIVIGRTADGIWDVSPGVRSGEVLLWERITSRPHLGWWPVVSISWRTTWRGRLVD